MIDDQPSDEHWLTYTEAAERLGLTVNAVRALARRQRWPRRSPNVIGGQAWVAVPANRLAINGHTGGDQRSKPAMVNDRPPAIIDHGSDDQRLEPATIDNHYGGDRRPNPADDRRSTEMLIAVQEMIERIAEPLREQIADLKSQLAAEKLLRVEDKEHADRAEQRARENENRIKELQEKLEAEMIEHRRLVGLMAERIPARRSWWRR